MLTWLLPQGTGGYPLFMPDDATAVFPDMYARAVVSLVSPLIRIYITGISISYLIGPVLGWLSCTTFLFSSPTL
jgi:hypothetical protein